MKRLFLIVLVVAFTSIQIHAGFFGNVLSGVTANTLTKTSSSKASSEDKEKVKAKKIQAVLTELQFYDYKLDGDLNTFDSRMAIKKWQKSKKSDFSDSPGVLSKKEENHILYLGDLMLKASQLDIFDLESLDKAEDRVKLILEETEDSESNFSEKRTYTKVKDSAVRFQKIKPILKELFTNKHIRYSKKWKKFYYINSSKVYSKDEVINVCQSVNVGGVKWKSINNRERRKYSFQEEIYPVLIPNEPTSACVGTEDGYISLFWDHRYHDQQTYPHRTYKKDKEYHAVCVLVSPSF